MVEDEDGIRHFTKRALESAGYKVFSAANGGEALLFLEQYDGPVHLLLTDVVMPGMTGRQLADRLRSIRPDTRVLYTSGYTDDTFLHHGTLDNESHFLGKPYAIAELTRKIRGVLDSGQRD